MGKLNEMLRQILLSIDWTNVLSIVIGAASSFIIYKYGSESAQYSKFKRIVDAGKPMADAFAQTSMQIKNKKVKALISKK